MKIVIAPDSFKESMTAAEAAEAINRGIKKVIPNANTVKVPVADGGEGTVQALINATNGKRIQVEVTGPLGNKVNAEYGILGNGKTAVIEMASASGLHLVPFHLRNPLKTTTKGTGELILHAAKKGVKTIIIGLGGSATNDGGAGMAQALGVRFLNHKNEDIKPGAESLNEIKTIDTSNLAPLIKNITIKAACDVTNPLIGRNGASAVFGPQKGTSIEDVKQLDSVLTHYAKVIKEHIGIDVAYEKGAGAAGGLGAGLLAFLKAELKQGIELVLDAIHFDKILEDADLVITGEGKIDSQTIYGKTPIGVAKRAKKKGIPVIALCGTLGEGYESVYEYGIDVSLSITNGVTSIEEALKQGFSNLERTSEMVARMLTLKCKLK